MVPWCPLRNLSRPPTSTTSESAKRSTSSASGNGPNKRRIQTPSASVAASRINDDRTPSGTPAPIRPRIRTIGDREEHDFQDEFDDSLDHVVVAVDKTRKKTVGCSYYFARHGVLYIMEDTENAEDETVHSCKVISHAFDTL